MLNREREKIINEGIFLKKNDGLYM